ncbi:hypothetical protein L6452_01797 [Arctium lappa]|uniref:Uncharacterized protein n=1 Tax=Arctium lappa TaxID=4217 RepID=A0ACB9FIJ9_ARCLA|nr:hypothetical protein L6452_01797 [Arctium lappa]
MMFMVFLGTDGADTEHCETKLHGDDEVDGEKKISGVIGVCGVAELGGDGVELIADESGDTGDGFYMHQYNKQQLLQLNFKNGGGAREEGAGGRMVGCSIY